MYEENLRVPLIFRHPGRVPGGRTIDAPVCNYDLFPSLAEYLAVGEDARSRPELPGTSYADVLRGKEPGARPETTFHEYEKARTVRTPQWKYTRRHPDGPDELFHLPEDPGERTNLADRPEYADVRGELSRQLEDFFSRYADPEYDLWKGGRSKAGRVL
jgi:arylsulfatase A-like enzyme